jgi:ATP-binding cassette, subfamily B, bacterial
MRLQRHPEIRELLTTGALSAVLDGAFASLYLVALLVLTPSMGLLVLGLGMLQVAVLVLPRHRNQRLMAESSMSRPARRVTSISC